MSTNPILSEFIRLHYEALLRYARKAARQDEEDAAEAVYRCLIKSPDPRLKDLSDATDIPGWLWQIIEWRVIEVRKKRLFLSKDGVVRMQSVPPEDMVEPHEQQAHTLPVSGAEKHPIFEALKSCWSVLSETERNILELRLLRDPPASPEEAASQLGMSYDTIKSRCYTGLSKLRQCLAQKGITEPRHLF